MSGEGGTRAQTGTMDSSSLLAGSWSAEESGYDTKSKDTNEDIQCAGCINWARAIDVSCGLAGAVLLVFSASCAVDPIADDFAEANCLAGAPPPRTHTTHTHAACRCRGALLLWTNATCCRA